MLWPDLYICTSIMVAFWRNKYVVLHKSIWLQTVVYIRIINQLSISVSWVVKFSPVGFKSSYWYQNTSCNSPLPSQSSSLKTRPDVIGIWGFWQALISICRQSILYVGFKHAINFVVYSQQSLHIIFIQQKLVTKIGF